MTVGEFFEAVFGAAPGRISLWTLPDRATYWPPDIAHAGQWVQRLAHPDAPPCDVYFGVCTRAQRVQGRGGREDISHVPGLWVEIDCDKHGEDKAETLRRLSPTPSIVVDSGGGLHCYWLFERALPASELGDVPRRWQRRIAALIGYAVDGTHDLARVLRPPGTLNRKYDPPRRVEVVHASPARYRLESLLSLCEAETSRSAAETSRSAPPVALEDLAHALGSVEAPTATADVEWRGIGFALRPYGDAGFDLWDSWSRTGGSAYPGREELWRRWCSFPADGGAYGPGTIYHYASRGGYDPRSAPWFRTVVEGLRASRKKAAALRRAPTRYEGSQQHAADCLADVLGHEYLSTPAGWYMWRPARGIWHLLPQAEATVAAAGSKRLHAAGVEARDRANDPELDAATRKAAEDDSAIWLKAGRSVAGAGGLAIVKRTAGNPRCSASVEELDAHPQLLVAGNGVVDLTDGSVRPCDPGLRLTKGTSIPYQAGAQCPTWDRFLLEVSSGDADFAAFLQRWAGYTATGDISEQVFAILQGFGSNGKSVFAATVGHVLGDYLVRTPFDTFLRRRQGSLAPYLARLKGARMALATEPPEGVELDEAVVKQLTSDDGIVAKHLYRDPFEFVPTSKLWLLVNPLPRLAESDPAIWRRVLVADFREHFSGARRDNTLSLRLREEAPGILRWIVDGARRWYDRGLRPPERVRLAVERYKIETDPVHAFIVDRCEIGPALEVPAQALHRAFLAWAQANDRPTVTMSALGRKLTVEGYGRRRDRDRGTIRTGLKLRGRHEA